MKMLFSTVFKFDSWDTRNKEWHHQQAAGDLLCSVRLNDHDVGAASQEVG